MATKRRKSLLIQLIFYVLISIYIGCKTQSSDVINTITLKELKKNVIGKNVQLIDVRTPKEYDKGHIDNAVNINIYDKNQFLKQVTQFNKTQPIYLYCHTGVRSKKASKILQKLGFTKIYDFSEGWKSWKKYELKPVLE